jgi:ABC-type transporter Mla subunit MlaD
VSYGADAQKHWNESLGHLRETVEALADRQTNARAALDSLIVHIDRFAKGEGGKSHKGGRW